MVDEIDLRQTVLRTTLSEVASSGDADSSAHPCVICLDEVSERARAIPCEHEAFDFVCLANWLEQNARCPLCNSTVTSVRYSFTSPSAYKVYKAPTAASKATTSHGSSWLQAQRRRSRRPPHQQTRSIRNPNPDAGLQIRRNVYRRSLFSLHVGANRLSRFASHPPAPADFVSDSALLGRAKTFMRRELQVFEFLRPREHESQNIPSSASRTSRTDPSANAEVLLSYLVALLKTVNLQDSSGRAEELLAEFIGQRYAALFLHELRAWLRSPYETMDAWDRHVQYNEDPRTNPEDNVRGDGEGQGATVDSYHRAETKRRDAPPGTELTDGESHEALKRRRIYPDRYVPS